MKKIYIYDTPSKRKEGLLKIGETTRDVKKRIEEQLNTAAATSKEDTDYKLYGEFVVIDKNGNNLSDKDIHKILKQKGYIQKSFDNNDRIKKTEWFKISYEKIEYLLNKINEGEDPLNIDLNRYNDFKMRPEQKEAVKKTIEQFKKDKTDFLWNAKMRFGKTFTAYQLAKRMEEEQLNCKNILILTYKPAVMSQWREDLNTHKDFKDYTFLTTNELDQIHNFEKKVVFLSYQDLLGKSEGTVKAKHLEVFKINWDLRIIDEYHYGASTEKALSLVTNKKSAEVIAKENVLEMDIQDKNLQKELTEELEQELAVLSDTRIHSKYNLYLSGTPFKALHTNQFSEAQIFNWTYVDEQKAKREWIGENNPYKDLPEVKLYIYEISKRARKIALNGDSGFSISEFFEPDQEKNRYSKNKEEHINNWLDLISGRSDSNIIRDENILVPKKIETNFPFDNDMFNLNHTLWYMSNIKSAEALYELLIKHATFKHYKIIRAFGKYSKSGAEALPPVLEAIRSNERTITLSCGMLTTGVSIPEWNGVLFLSNISAPEKYFQTAFRVQTPAKNKKECYIFDFDPIRSLKLLAIYAKNIIANNKTEQKSSDSVNKLINYLPVLASRDGEMHYLNGEDILKYEYEDLNAEKLGKYFESSKLVNVNDKTIDAIANGDIDIEKLNSILNSIKKFKNFNSSEKEEKEIDISKNAKNNEVLGKLKKERAKEGKEEKTKEEIAIEKENEKMLKEIRELLRTLLSRIPVFMYLTNASEDSLLEVIKTKEPKLFKKTTGISPENFNDLIKMGMLQVDSIEGYILKFKELEEENFKSLNKMVIKSNV